MPLVVTKLARDRVEVWGMVRPAPGKARVVISAAPRRRGAAAETVRSTVTGRNGYFRIRLARHRAAGLRYRAQWTAPGGDVFSSRLASAGRKIRYKPLR
jgi:hypothetical protein